jgi:hypothetical protein
MFSVLALSAVDRGFEPRSGHTRDYEIDRSKISIGETVLISHSDKILLREQSKSD